MGDRRFTGDEIEYLSSRCVEKLDAAQMQEIRASLERIKDEVYGYRFVGKGTFTSATLMQQTVTAQTQPPQITLTIRSDTYRFTPQRDITAFEATRIMALLIPALVTPIAAQDLASWWDEAGPGIWRHFSAI